MQDLIVLSEADHARLKRDLKAAGVDLCYTVHSARPIRRRWRPERLHDPDFLQQVARRRPSDPSYRLASVHRARAGNVLWPDTLTVSFHAVSPSQEAALQQYLETHPVGPPDVPADAEAAHGHATPFTYVQIALLLAFITAFEVGLLYLPEDLRPPRWGLLLVLLLLSAMKFGIVVSFYMHLRYDHRLYAGIFVGGLAVATGTILALLALFREGPRPMLPVPVAAARAESPAPPAAPPTVATLPSGDPVAGQRVFLTYGCGGCHALSGLPEARGTIGPGLDGLSQRAGSRVPGLSAEAYLRQSVEEPNAHTVKGYLKLMPALRAQMSEQEFADLLAFLRTL